MSLLHESRITLKLALPLMIGQLSQMLMGVVDTVMVGRLGVQELAALTFVNSLFYVPFIFGIGLLTGISVFTSNSRGANDPAGARGSCRHGLYLSLVLGVVLFALTWGVSLHLDFFKQPADVMQRAKGFFQIIMASIIPALASIALKNHADALNRPWPPFWIFLGGVGLNVVLNWVMIYGNLGCPALGFEGAAWATLISRIAILVAMFWWLKSAKDLHEWVPARWFSALHLRDLGQLLSIGLPASLQMMCEVSAFSSAGLLMGFFEPTALATLALAAHQIAITLAGTAFMIPLGLSMALTVRVGEAKGAGEIKRLRPIAVSGWLLGAGYSLVAAVGFLVCGKWIAAKFIDAPEVIALAASLLVVVGLFQLFDSLQVAAAAMLRGLEDARVPALMGFVSYWVVALPVGTGLAFGCKLGPIGIWWGLAAGLFVAAATLGPRLWKFTRPSRGL
jgi:multidrug resistance protein, MATE family